MIKGSIFLHTQCTTTGSVVVWDATFWWHLFPSLNFSKILSDTLVSLGTDISLRKQVLSLWFFTTNFQFAWIHLSNSHKMVAFLFLMNFRGLCSHQLLSYGRLKFLHKHQWMYCPYLSCQFIYSVGATMGQPDTW